MSYDELLDNAYSKIEKETSSSRFEMPDAVITFEGNKTIINNFGKISSYLNRDEKHVEKFLEKELAAKGDVKGHRLFLYIKIPKKQVKDKLREYFDKYVVCKNCGKPDTEIKEKKGKYSINCLACGDKQPIYSI